jgi:hypothetical protein
MRKFIFKALYFASPLIIIILISSLLYIKRDVYADFGHKKNYSWKYSFQQLGDISTKKLLSLSTDYNSFIFGSSRTTGVYACYLQKKIPNSKFYHYACWNETIGGIYEKMRLLDSLGYKIDNVIVYFDTDVTFKNDGKCQSSDHYLLTKEKKSKYILNHYKTFFSGLNLERFKILLGYQVEGEIFPNWESDLNTNDPDHTCTDSIIDSYGDLIEDEMYYHKIDSLRACGFLYDRPNVQSFKEKQISNFETNVLLDLKGLFYKHHTNYRIVITPLYDQLKFDPSDLQTIRNCFGENVYDFSGKNEITKNIYNYALREHFQNYISKNILDSIIK